ncbi:hypothetical protein [Mesorhizobium sp.]|uniref:hypothetical protein n=1 Tax=Mesorhizobium sp. TaxID=1871066 RepID=UPI000FEA31B2|nr:hypothetical protein [Mesorhizobium sp.]RWO52603.1 MAG: hypothetical protein EOS14_34320 [Mesorhizobium sp.]
MVALLQLVAFGGGDFATLPTTRASETFAIAKTRDIKAKTTTGKAEAKHFEHCPVCGQDFDMRDLGVPK